MINIKEDTRAMNHHLMYLSPRQLCWSDWEMGRDALLSHAEEVVMPVFILYIRNGAASCALEQLPCIAMSDCNVPHVINGQIASYPGS